MKRLFIFGLLALAGCGNADKANDALPVKELMAKSKTELTAEQWNVKKTLFKVLTENVEFENGEFVLDITKKEFTENGLPASYYKEATESVCGKKPRKTLSAPFPNMPNRNIHPAT